MSEADIACLLAENRDCFTEAISMKKILFALASILSVIATAGASFSWK